MNPTRPENKDITLPKQVEQIKHWIELIGLDPVLIKDSKEQAFNFIIPIKACPDIHVALESKFKHISFFSNVLTSLKDESDKNVQEFLQRLLRLQSKYFSSRVIATGPSDDVRIFLGYRLDEVSMYRFSRKIRELIQFVQEIALLIEELGMSELWRQTEQEPKFPEIDISERVRFL